MRLKLVLYDGDRRDRFVEVTNDVCPILNSIDDKYMKILFTYFRQNLRLADIKIQSGIVDESDLYDVQIVHGIINHTINKHYNNLKNTKEVFCIEYSDIKEILDCILFTMWKVIRKKHDIVILTEDIHIKEASEAIAKLIELYIDKNTENLYDIQKEAEALIGFIKSLNELYNLIHTELKFLMSKYPDWYRIEDIYFVFNY